VTKCDQNLMIRLWSLYYLSGSLSSCNVNSPTCKPCPHAARVERRDVQLRQHGDLSEYQYTYILSNHHSGMYSCQYTDMPVWW